MDVETWKTNAAKEAAKLVRDGMIVGLGSGSTVAKVIKAISELKPNATFVTSSFESQRLADKLGLRLSSLDVYHDLEMMIDGADELDPNFDMIKGHGGAHTREKIVAGAAKRVVIVVDRTKLVKKLGERFPVPVEILPHAPEYTMSKLAELGGQVTLRMVPSATPFVTDNGNYLVDIKFRKISNPAKLEQKINNYPGVIDNGLFAGVADLLLVGHDGGCATLKSKKDFLKFIKSK